MGELRQRANRDRILEQFVHDAIGTREDSPECLIPGEIQDDLLRMLFVSCDAAIPVESQLVFALKTLCGFDVREIAHRLFASEANVYKRLGVCRIQAASNPYAGKSQPIGETRTRYSRKFRVNRAKGDVCCPHLTAKRDQSDRLLGRARNRLRNNPPILDELTSEQHESRLPAVNKILYLLFTEGYLASHTGNAIRRELCDEAIRLTAILAQHPIGQAPQQTFALLALMHLHVARMTSRQDASGGLLLLEEQDRALWDQQRIQVGLEWLAKSACGDEFSRYHAEAGIAAEHCLASSFEETRWDKIVECYRLLEETAPSAIHRLNRSIAVAEWQGPAAGLTVLKGFEPPGWLMGSYLWPAVLADLHRRCEHTAEAKRYREEAFKSAPTPAVKELLKRRLQDASRS